MPKRSGMLDKLEAKDKAKLNAEIGIFQQMCIDATFMAANDVFQMGPGRCEAFGQAMVSYLHEMAVLMNEDGRVDKDMVYTCAKVDERLKKICGDKFEPWEVRYGDGK